MFSARTELIELIEQGVIPAHKIPEALVAARITPDARAWQKFTGILLLSLGGLALAFAVLFFIAYNWNDLGRFTKFGMVETLIILSIFTYCKLEENLIAGQMALQVATILLGVLLALYGQVYQTGADPWQLFFNWAVLMLPWAIIGRFAAIWIVWFALVNTALSLHWNTFRGAFWFLGDSDSSVWWLAFILNTLVFVTWQLLAQNFTWLLKRWAICLLALSSGVPITWLTMAALFRIGDGSIWSGVVWAGWLATMYLVYRKIKPDLFMLAGCCLSLILVTVAFFSKHLLEDLSSAGFLFLAMIVIGMGTGSALWLKKLHQEFLI